MFFFIRLAIYLIIAAALITIFVVALSAAIFLELGAWVYARISGQPRWSAVRALNQSTVTVKSQTQASFLRSKVGVYVNCSLTRVGKVERVVLTRTKAGDWDVALHVDCGDPDNPMVLSRTSQTHMFFLPETQGKITAILQALEWLDTVDEVPSHA